MDKTLQDFIKSLEQMLLDITEKHNNEKDTDVKTYDRTYSHTSKFVDGELVEEDKVETVNGKKTIDKHFRDEKENDINLKMDECYVKTDNISDIFGRLSCACDNNHCGCKDKEQQIEKLKAELAETKGAMSNIKAELEQSRLDNAKLRTDNKKLKDKLNDLTRRYAEKLALIHDAKINVGYVQNILEKIL